VPEPAVRAASGFLPAGPLWAYRTLTTAALVGGVLVLPALAVLRRRWLEGLGERLGALPVSAAGAVWVHAASVGEVRIAEPLVLALAALGQRAVVSTTTVAGRALARQRLAGVPCSLAPLDHPAAVRRAMGRVRPRALVLIETELWPELLAEAWRRRVPAFLVSGRISERTFNRYRSARRLLAPLLAGLAGVQPRSEEDRERLLALGCRPEALLPSGDLKAAGLATAEGTRVPGSRPVAVLVAGSLHASELVAWASLLDRTRALPLAHVIAPRHLERLDELRAALSARGLPHVAWSSLRPVLPDPVPPVVVVDTIGDLACLYGAGDLAFVGGSLMPDGAGHSLLEPAALGRGVLFGAGVRAQAHTARALLAAGGAVQVASAEELAGRLERLIADRGEMRGLGERAQQQAAREREAGQLALQLAVEAILFATAGRGGT
jgi:3-deoxy-D-manno-octulosonic-acid transferase